jgi:hypothetical protein
MSIRWTRGLFRTWIVLTTLWIGAVGYVALQDHYSGRGLTDEEVGITSQSIAKAMTYDEAMAAKPPFDPTKPYEVLRPPINYARVLSLALIPPSLLLVLGCAGLWVLRGFRA